MGFSTGISTFTDCPAGSSAVTVGAFSLSEVTGMAGMGSFTVSPFSAALSTTAAVSFTRASIRPSWLVVVEPEPSLLMTVVWLEPSVFSTVSVLLPSLSVVVVVTLPSLSVFTTSWEPSGLLVVSVVEPSGLVTVVVVEPEELPPPEEPPGSVLCPAFRVIDLAAPVRDPVLSSSSMTPAGTMEARVKPPPTSKACSS